MADFNQIDFFRLKEDLINECYGAFFGAGCGGALIESFDIDSMSPEELLEIAERQGVDIEKYLRQN